MLFLRLVSGQIFAEAARMKNNLLTGNPIGEVAFLTPRAIPQLDEVSIALREIGVSERTAANKHDHLGLGTARLGRAISHVSTYR